jgi:hypothetical protein
MARALLSATPNKFDLFSFAPFILDEDAAVQTCYDLGLIPSVIVSAEGYGVMSRQNEPSRKLGFRWYCNICKTKVSPTTNTLFARVRLDFSRIFRLLLPLCSVRVECRVLGKEWGPAEFLDGCTSQRLWAGSTAWAWTAPQLPNGSTTPRRLQDT